MVDPAGSGPARSARGRLCSRNALRFGGTLEQLARKQKYMTQSGEMVENTLLATPQDWLNIVQPIADTVREGERYVFFDGHVFPAKNGPIKFDGICRSHDLPELPHLSESLTEQTLANPDYWSDS